MRVVLALLLLTAGAATAQTPLKLPSGAVRTHQSVEDPGQYALPVGPITFSGALIEPLEGRVEIRAWRLPDGGAGTLATMRALRPQLADAGYEVIFDCAAAACGGFDYRVGTRVLPPPAMEVNLTDFRVLSGQSAEDPPRHINLLVSRTGGGGWVQAIEVLPSGAAPLELDVPPAVADATVPAPETTLPASDDPLAAMLRSRGRMVLEGVTFASGTRTLAEESVSALKPLADAMASEPALNIMLVGHSDDTGGLDQNIALSRARAQAVRQVLISRFGIEGGRIEAAGAGFLAPLVPNTSDAGRARNRRVEAILR